MIKKLKDNNVILNGHFLLRSGRHSDCYINKDLIYCNTGLFNITIVELFNSIKRNFDIETIDVITGPAIAGAILAAPLSLVLNKTFIYPEKDSTQNMVFNRGYDKILDNKNVLIIEDIITTGSSVIKTKNSIELCNGKVVGIISIWNRSGKTDLFDIKNISLINSKVESWDKNECPFCRDNIKLTDPKTGKEI